MIFCVSWGVQIDFLLFLWFSAEFCGFLQLSAVFCRFCRTDSTIDVIELQSSASDRLAQIIAIAQASAAFFRL